MRRVLTTMVIGAAAFAVSIGPVLAYTTSPDGSYAVTSTELQSAFGTGVDLTKITFAIEGGHTWYSVPCKKSLGNGKKTMTKAFTRQTHTLGETKAVPTASGFTVTVTSSTVTDIPGCPTGWLANGAPRQLAKSQAMHLIATSGELPIELAAS